MDLQWCPAKDSEWALLSVSEDSNEAAGGTMQVWRINDMIHRPHDEVVAELEQHRCVRRCPACVLRGVAARWQGYSGAGAAVARSGTGAGCSPPLLPRAGCFP